MFFLDVNPSVVRPGWTPLIITILLAAAIALLMISMRRQMRKISVPHRDEIDSSAADNTGAAGPSGSGDEQSDGGTRPDGASRGTTLNG